MKNGNNNGRINFSLAGLDCTLFFSSTSPSAAADDIVLLTKILLDGGAAPPGGGRMPPGPPEPIPAPPAPPGPPPGPGNATPSQAPLCPEHGVRMLPSTKEPGSYFCPEPVGYNSNGKKRYCTHTVKFTR
jgi:hypothetical protein